MAEKKRILILGGGYGGVWAGKILEKHFRARQDVEVTLVDKKPYHTLMTELHEVAGWRTEPDAIRVSFRKIFGAKKIEVVHDKILGVNFETKKANSAVREYPFDYIVVGVGAEPEYFGIPGVEENSFTLWSFGDAMEIRTHLEQTFARAAQEIDPGKRKKLLTFVVAGAGFTGIEMIGELLEYRDLMCRKLFLDPKEVRVINIEALPSILPILEEPLRVKAAKYLQKHGCEIMLNKAIVGAEPGKVMLKDGMVVETDTFIWTCGVKGNAFAGSLAVPMGKRNRIECDEEMKSPTYPFAYVVGDNAGLMVDGKPMAQIVESAHFSAEAAAKNIIADIDGGARHKFHANYHGFMISLGGRYAVANAGGMKTSGFIAMAMKHLINLYYLFMIAGFNQMWEYAKHEFLDIGDRRSFIGGFVAYKQRAYWPLLLRMWLGLMWVMEGVNKIGEGWLNFAKGTSSGWMFSAGVTQVGVPVVEATSAATGEGEWAAEVVEAVTEAVPQAFQKVWDLSLPILDPNSGIVTWFRQTFMDGIFANLSYQLFQVMIVGMEVAIGMAILGGLFTWPAAVASIGMCLVFTMSGMFSWSQLWFIFAAILMMGGAGRAFGFDYWLVPVIKRWWNGTRFARRTHLYGDDPTK